MSLSIHPLTLKGARMTADDRHELIDWMIKLIGDRWEPLRVIRRLIDDVLRLTACPECAKSDGPEA